MPQPILDAFTGTNNANLATALPRWTMVPSAGQVGLNTNAFYPDTTGAFECAAYLNTEVPAADQFAQIVVAAIAATNSASVGSAVRCGTVNHDYYGFYTLLGASQFFKVVAGTWTQFGADLAAGAVGAVLRIEARGSTLRALLNGVQVATTTDSSIASGRLGVTPAATASTTATRGDDLQAGDVILGRPAPTFVGAGTAAFTATASATITPTLPSGWQPDDIHILVAAGSNNTDWPEPAGWTKLSPGGSTGAVAAENNTTAQRVEIWWRRAVAGDTDPVLSTYTGTTVRGARILGVRGVSPLGVPLVAFSRNNKTTTTDATVPTVNLNVSDDATLGVMIYCYEDDPNSTTSDPAGWAATDVATSNLGTDMAIGHSSKVFTAAGSYGSPTWTVTGGSFANSVNVAFLLAFAAGETYPAERIPAQALNTLLRM